MFRVPPQVALPIGAALLALAIAGCAGSGTGGGGGGGGGGANCKKPPPATVSFSGNIQPIFNRSCATSTACHVGATAAQGLQLTAGTSYGAIVNVPATEKPKLLLVKPGAPNDSYLLQKVENAPGIAGVEMPQGCPGTPLGGAVCPSADEITAIRTWIMECAQNN